MLAHHIEKNFELAEKNLFLEFGDRWGRREVPMYHIGGGCPGGVRVAVWGIAFPTGKMSGNAAWGGVVEAKGFPFQGATSESAYSTRRRRNCTV